MQPQSQESNMWSPFPRAVCEHLWTPFWASQVPEPCSQPLPSGHQLILPRVTPFLSACRRTHVTSINCCIFTWQPSLITSNVTTAVSSGPPWRTAGGFFFSFQSGSFTALQHILAPSCQYPYFGLDLTLTIVSPITLNKPHWSEWPSSPSCEQICLQSSSGFSSFMQHPTNHPCSFFAILS